MRTKIMRSFRNTLEDMLKARNETFESFECIVWNFNHQDYKIEDFDDEQDYYHESCRRVTVAEFLVLIKDEEWNNCSFIGWTKDYVYVNMYDCDQDNLPLCAVPRNPAIKFADIIDNYPHKVPYGRPEKI